MTRRNGRGPDSSLTAVCMSIARFFSSALRFSCSWTELGTAGTYRTLAWQRVRWWILDLLSYRRRIPVSLKAFEQSVTVAGQALGSKLQIACAGSAELHPGTKRSERVFEKTSYRHANSCKRVSIFVYTWIKPYG